MRTFIACVCACTLAFSTPAFAAPQEAVAYVASMVEDASLPATRMTDSVSRSIGFTDDGTLYAATLLTLPSGVRALRVGIVVQVTGRCVDGIVEYLDLNLDGTLDLTMVTAEVADCEYRPPTLLAPDDASRVNYDALIENAVRFGLRHSAAL